MKPKKKSYGNVILICLVCIAIIAGCGYGFYRYQNTKDVSEVITDDMPQEYVEYVGQIEVRGGVISNAMRDAAQFLSDQGISGILRDGYLSRQTGEVPGVKESGVDHYYYVTNEDYGTVWYCVYKDDRYVFWTEEEGYPVDTSGINPDMYPGNLILFAVMPDGYKGQVMLEVSDNAGASETVYLSKDNNYTTSLDVTTDYMVQYGGRLSDDTNNYYVLSHSFWVPVGEKLIVPVYVLEDNEYTEIPEVYEIAVP